MTILVTGAAGFIGFHAAARLARAGERVVGVDSLTEYYDVGLKQARLAELAALPGFSFERLDIADAPALRALVEREQPSRIIHLAAQAGVRYSIENPFAYAHSNLTGHLSVLEAARALGDGLHHLVYASSSSVYGERGGVFREEDAGDPVSLYAATKRADEAMSAAYAHLYGIPATGLRFFTVYGPWGRPDMAYWRFADAMLDGRTIPLFNHGRNERDFTYIDDVAEPVVKVALDTPERGRSRIYNIGGSRPVTTIALVEALERVLGVSARTEMLPPQPGDVTHTCADVTRLQADYGCAPDTTLEDGVARFASWFRDWRALHRQAG